MAQKMQVLYTDDIDGSEAQGTVRFGYDGSDYEIDLSKKNADKLAKALAPFIEAGRRVPARRAGRGARHASRHNQSDVREWARAQGIKVSDRGRIPADVMTQYQAAH
jgi:Lsr2